MIRWSINRIRVYSYSTFQDSQNHFITHVVLWPQSGSWKKEVVFLSLYFLLFCWDLEIDTRYRRARERSDSQDQFFIILARSLAGRTIVRASFSGSLWARAPKPKSSDVNCSISLSAKRRRRARHTALQCNTVQTGYRAAWYAWGKISCKVAISISKYAPWR